METASQPPLLEMSLIILSIIIPNYNYGHFIEEAIDSILNTNRRNDFEIIVVDDGSTDHSRRLLKKYQNRNQIRIHYHDDNLGVAYTLNRGIHLAQGSYLHFFASDDLHLPGTVDDILAFIEKYPKVPLFCGDYSYFDTKENVCTIASLPFSTLQFLHGVRLKCLLKHTDFWIPGHTVFVKKEIHQNFGPVDSEWGPLCDWIINHQIALKEGVAYIPKPLVTMRRHTNSLNSTLSLVKRRELWLKLLHRCRKEAALHELGKIGIFRMLGLKAIRNDLLFNPFYWRYTLPIMRKIVEKQCFKLFGISQDHFWANRSHDLS